MTINISHLSRSARFGSEPIPLDSLTAWSLSGRIRLPDFQRGWLWGCGEVAALLEALALGQDIGDFVLLESNGFSVGFKSVAMEGATEESEHPSIAYLLDGRQRLTALTHALRGPILPPLDGLDKDFRLDLDRMAREQEDCIRIGEENLFPLRGCFDSNRTPASILDRTINCMRVKLTRDLA